MMGFQSRAGYIREDPILQQKQWVEMSGGGLPFPAVTLYVNPIEVVHCPRPV